MKLATTSIRVKVTLMNIITLWTNHKKIFLTHLHSEQLKQAWWLWKYFTYKSMFTVSHTTTLIQTFCELSLNSKVIFKSKRVADVYFLSNSECECMWWPDYCPSMCGNNISLKGTVQTKYNNIYILHWTTTIVSFPLWKFINFTNITFLLIMTLTYNLQW